MDDDIRISANGFAECALAFPSISNAKVRPYKFKNKGEGAGRSGYYKKALDTIREYHRSGNDKSVLARAKSELAALHNSLDEFKEFRTRVKLAKNIDALNAYQSVYGDRTFIVHSRHRLALRIGNVTVTAQPDLWVSENGNEVLIKVGTAKKNSQHVDILLYLMRKAAVSSGYRIRAKNVVYLDVTNGKERCCRSDLIRFNRMFRNVAGEIESVWNNLS